MVNQQNLETFIKTLKAKNITESQVVAFREFVNGSQTDLDRMRTMPQFRQYVEQHKLSLLDSNFKMLDNLLEMGILE